MGLRAELTAEVGEVFGDVMDELEDGFLTCTLCKQSATLNQFEDVLDVGNEIGNVWFFEYSEFRQAFRLSISSDDALLTAAMAEATHVQIDSDYYVIRNADTIPPKGTDVMWKIFCERFAERGQFRPIY